MYCNEGNKKTIITRFVTILISGMAMILLSSEAFAQSSDSIKYLSDEFYKCPTDGEHKFNEGELSLKVEGMAFFRDNEYDSDVSKGYTLPGAWLRPAMVYNPLNNVHLELGISGLFFSGANKYPNYAYHDIAKWKCSQYQDGLHLLPWFRAEMKTGHFDFILGDIYGGTNHHFITPLYNNEQILSADPEMGAQILFTSKYFKSDLFINWQSFQFNEDTHQEAFELGFSSVVRPFTKGSCKDISFPIAFLAQHRGGELDDAENGVQTICNGSAGIAWDQTYYEGHINHLRIEGDLIGCMQQAGHLWDFSKGLAFHTSGTMTFFKDLHAQLGYFCAPSNFISIFGNPNFSTISLKHTEMKYTSMNTMYLDFGYSHTFGKSYTFGANAEVFNDYPGGGTKDVVFTIGLHIIVKPEFLLKKFR